MDDLAETVASVDGEAFGLIGSKRLGADSQGFWHPHRANKPSVADEGTELARLVWNTCVEEVAEIVVVLNGVTLGGTREQLQEGPASSRPSSSWSRCWACSDAAAGRDRIPGLATSTVA
ncbi:hypothetical protein [Lentzea sp. NPDC055074]